MRFLADTLWLALLAVTAGCASAPAPAPAPKAASKLESEPVSLERGPASYETEIGGLSQYDVEQQLRALEPRLIDCVNRAAENMSYLGGRVNLRMRVDREGNVRWAYLKETTLGDRDTERCVLSVVKNRTWPKPKSGDGLAETSFDVDAAEPPAALPARKSAALAKSASALTRSCRKGVRGQFTATAYLDKRGTVLSVGVAPPDENGEPAADCVAEALRDLRLKGRLASNSASKVSFRIGP